MRNDTYLELGLLALFALVTVLLGALWQAGVFGGFVVLVSFTTTLTWSLWLGWQPALRRLQHRQAARPGTVQADERDVAEVPV